MEDLDDNLYPMFLFAKNSKKYNDQKKKGQRKKFISLTKLNPSRAL
jgi:hypothetical protein